MTCQCLFVVFGIALLTLWICKKILNKLTQPPPLPDLQRNQYWGPGEPPQNEDTSIRPFKIEFTADMIADLRLRLKNTRYTKPLENIGFQYGYNNEGLKPLVDYWMNKYDFNERQKFLNQLPQFMTKIQGLDMHYIHIKPNTDDKIRTVPLLMLHGWPGSIREFYRIIDIFVTSDPRFDFKFELIVPSLPGFAYSEGASKPGMGAAHMGVVLSNLMARLGHKKYYIQGGDWGSIIGSHIATMFPDEVLGFHTNMAMVLTPTSIFKFFIASFCPSLFIEKEFIDRIYPLKKSLMLLLEETGYYHIQSTKPDTLGVGLNNSPAGLAAWIVEKFPWAITEDLKVLPDGGLSNMYGYDEMIDNVMMYWVTNSATTAARMYAESVNKYHLGLGLEKIPTPVPTAIARFPKEHFFQPKFHLTEKYPNIVSLTDFSRGGHFPAMQDPELLSEDIKNAIVEFEKFNRNK